jgi:hypothetical protein
MGLVNMTTSAITTKKILVAYDPARPEAASSDFMAPINDSAGLLLYGLRSRAKREQGLMVYIGKSITVNDVFAKLVDSGRKIENVAQTLAALEAYLRMLQDFKIGNILTVEACAEEDCGFRLKKIAETPPVKRVNLP